MYRNRFEGNQRRLRVIERHAESADEALNRIVDRRDQIVGRLEKQFGMSKHEADQRVADWVSRHKI